MANQPGFKSSNSGIVLGSANIANCTLDANSTTDAFSAPVGNTLQRPANSQMGMFRWTTDGGHFEQFDGHIWAPFGGASINISPPNGAIQYNSSNTLGGDANLIWNNANTTIIISGNVVSNGNTFLGAGANTGYVPSYFGGTPGFLHQDSGNKSFGAFFRYEVTPFGPSFALGKSRGIGAGNLVSAIQGDELGDITFIGTDGINWIPAARIYALIDNVVSTNTIPSAITFWTGTSNNETERMRISSAGQVGIGTTSPQTPLDTTGTVRANNYQDHYANTGTPATFSNTFITSNNCNVFPNGSIIVTNAASANWDAFAFEQPMSALMIRGQQTDNGGAGMMIGLSQNPTTMQAGQANANQTYVALDFALYYNSGTFLVYENGVQIATFGGYTAGNGGAVMYDGNNATYFANTYIAGWVPIRTINKPGLTMSPAYAGIGNRRGNIAANVFFATAQTIDLTVGTYQDITLANNIYITLQNCATTGNTSTISLILRQTAQTNCGIAFSNTIRWSDNKIPGLSAGPNTGDVITLMTYNGGTTWWGGQVYGNTPLANVY